MFKILGRLRFKKVIKDWYFLSKIWCTKGDLLISLFFMYRYDNCDFVEKYFLQPSTVLTCFLYQKKNAARTEKQDGEETWALSRFFPLIEACDYWPSLVFNKNLMPELYGVPTRKKKEVFQQQDWHACSIAVIFCCLNIIYSWLKGVSSQALAVKNCLPLLKNKLLFKMYE